MGNICSACQRDKEDSKSAQPKRHEKNLPISLYIEKQRINYTDSVSKRYSMAYLDQLEDSNNDKPFKIQQTDGVQEFWKKNKKKIKGFNTTIRPSTTYQIDGRLAIKYLNSNSDRFESQYYETDVQKLHQAATTIQRWFKCYKKAKMNFSNLISSCSNFNYINRTQDSYSFNTVDVTIRQS
ncbi:hypothetical protein ABPG72_004743 [Tetrahymena utriculariae]